QLAREALRRLTGAAVVGELARLPAGFAPPVLEPAAAQAWVARAEAESLEVRLARYGVALAREEVARQRAQRFPQLDLVARYGRQDGVQLQQGLEATVSERAVGLQLRPVLAPIARSEEHTSELQSRENIVCRLLRVKKIRIRV